MSWTPKSEKKVAEKSPSINKWGKLSSINKWLPKDSSNNKWQPKDTSNKNLWLATKGKDVSNINKNTWRDFSFQEQVFSQVNF